MESSSTPYFGKWFKRVEQATVSAAAVSLKDGGAESSRLLCTLCPRACSLKPGDRGFCFVRENQNGKMVLSTYGKSTGFCIDPIEKKPLNHFYPGTPVLSFGTAGCNLGCKFCQNWDISKSRETERLSAIASPEQIALAAKSLGCTSVAFTYNDPVIWAEYAIDTAKACHDLGIKTVAVTAGYITAEARSEFFAHMDAANVDLKAFTEEFYFSVTSSHLANVLETLVYLKHETNVWFEITNLVIPAANDSADEIKRMCAWIAEKLGPDTPIHFSAFHPDYKMMDRPRTPAETLYLAYEIAIESGLQFPYIGNIHDSLRQNTRCPSCGQTLIERDWYQLGQYNLVGSACRFCGTPVPGRFGTAAGDWGPKRQPVDIQRFQANSLRKKMATTNNEQSTSSPAHGPIPVLDENQKRSVLRAACAMVISAVTGASQDAGDEFLDEKLKTLPVEGVFVSLHKGSMLRGCCGSMGHALPLLATLKQSATRTALHDHRFPPVSISEVQHLKLDVTLLGPMTRLDVMPSQRASAIQVGKHGLRIRAGQQSGLLLPHVAVEQRWNAHQFLEGVCRKAGLPAEAWRSDDTILETFEGDLFGANVAELKNDQQLASAITESTQHNAPSLTPPQLVGLTRWVENNLHAIRTGATPFYYASELPDINVCGLIVSATDRISGQSLTASQVQTRPALAMQSNLFQITNALAGQIPRGFASENIQITLAVLTDARLLGSDAEPDLQAFDCRTDALLATGGAGHVIHWSFSKDSESILMRTTSSKAFIGDQVRLVGFRCYALVSEFLLSKVTESVSQISVRPPAIAGRFYPADDLERDQLVSELIRKGKEKYGSSISDRPQHPVAMMTPHAGLQYSGAVAAMAWSSVQIPGEVIIIGPKHTDIGVRWAVAPHNTWQLSAESSLPGNIELATKIAHSVKGMQLDSAAHAQEHGIEVQLPFLKYLSPTTNVTAIALGSGDFHEIDEAAQQFAELIKSLESAPLLVISSDMNHFASDEENRRRDKLALDAFLTCDGKLLLQTCRENQISMCGVLPAVFVLETLKHMQHQISVEHIAYATSAEVSGITDRVVGYAASLIFSR